MASIGSTGLSVPKGQPFQTLDGRWAWLCKGCATLNVSKTEPKKQGAEYPCTVCAEREAQREQRRLRRQEEAAKQRWGS